MNGGAYQDRQEAGRVLAGHLAATPERADRILGLPRGGVVVACEVARALQRPLDILVVRKVTAPHAPEYALGAVSASGDVVVTAAGREVQATRPEFERWVETALTAARERRRALVGDRPDPDLRGQRVWIVDDGLATGATMRLALRAVRSPGAAWCGVAVPVGPSETVTELAMEADAVVCPLQPPRFRAVGQWIGSFPQVSDAEVRSLLAADRGEPYQTP